ncbi:MAG TPA: hypothetical protein VF110_03085 [Burkholderiales bacterium]
MLKKTILATVTGAAVLASGATFADNGRHYGHYKQGHRDVVVKHVYHRPAPRPVVVYRHYHQPRPVVVHRPAPVYYSNDGLAILAGAVIGGAIAYGIANH